jgi:hypothetical protein
LGAVCFEWWQNGLLHQENGLAVEWFNVDCVNGGKMG